MSQSPNKRYLITQSLLSAWGWALKLENGYEEFLATLRREPTKPTKAMLDGLKFEKVLNATLNGAEIDKAHEWHKPIAALSSILQGAQQQVALSREITIGSIDFLLYGKLDYLKAGIIYDTKFSKTYRTNKYLDSPQHPMYFALVPEAREFRYLICDGEWVYTESYKPDEIEPVEQTIKHFMDFLDKMDMVKTYCDNWQARS